MPQGRILVFDNYQKCSVTSSSFFQKYFKTWLTLLPMHIWHSLLKARITLPLHCLWSSGQSGCLLGCEALKLSSSIKAALILEITGNLDMSTLNLKFHQQKSNISLYSNPPKVTECCTDRVWVLLVGHITNVHVHIFTLNLQGLKIIMVESFPENSTCLGVVVFEKWVQQCSQK